MRLNFSLVAIVNTRATKEADNVNSLYMKGVITILARLSRFYLDQEEQTLAPACYPPFFETEVGYQTVTYQIFQNQIKIA